jgi:crotonobetainyl-CoA:carnitine CoA-transferase CaiB-like acyl-CoA transferase
LLMTILQGIRVTSLATNIPGPVAAARLRDMGATLVKVEPPNGDALALASPKWYADLHNGVEVLGLDLKTSRGMEQLHELLVESDLLLTASRPSALRRLGLEWSRLAGRYPRLCQVAIVGYPPPMEEKPGHDLTYQARLGLVKPPDLPLTVLADLAGAERAVTAALALLYWRERATSNGAVLDEGDRFAWAPLSDAAAAFAEPLRHGLTEPGGLLGGLLPGYNLYESKDGWIAIAALERHFLARLAQGLALERVTRDAMKEAFLTRTAAEWEEWAAERDIPLLALKGRFDVW